MKKRIMAGVLALSLVAGLATGCKKETTNQVDSGLVDWTKYTESSDIPDWGGKQLKISYWFADGKASSKRNKLATDDVVTKEIFRVTGVMYDPEASFDNGGQDSMEAKLGKLSAANQYPAVVERADRAQLQKLAKADLIYDLTDLIPKYCPNIMKALPKDTFSDVWNDTVLNINGKIYGVPISFPVKNVERMIDTTTYNQDTLIKMEIVPTSSRGYFYIRDDVLKKIYPNAKTKDELDKLFMQNGGKFNQEDYNDVQINSPEDYYDLLYKIKALNIVENGKPIYPTFSHNGGDNWPLMTQLFGQLYGFNILNGSNNNYFTYFDKETQKIEFTFKQPWFKDIVLKWNKMVRDDVVSKESLIDNTSNFNTKLNSGEYAVTPNLKPSDAVLEKAGKSFKYRKVLINIPPNYNKFVYRKDSALDGGGVVAAIFKSAIKEEDLPQLLSFYDFMYSEAGRKLAVWGPKSAGLFTEENGVRKYIDKELEDCIINNVSNDEDLKYGLQNKNWPGYPYNYANPLHPILTAGNSVQLKATMSENYYNYGFIEPLKTVDSKSWYINAYSSLVPSVKKFWETRPAFESALKKVLTAGSDDEFNKLYDEFVNLAVSNGGNDQTLEDFNKAFKEDNKEYLNNLK